MEGMALAKAINPGPAYQALDLSINTGPHYSQLFLAFAPFPFILRHSRVTTLPGSADGGHGAVLAKTIVLEQPTIPAPL